MTLTCAVLNSLFLSSSVILDQEVRSGLAESLEYLHTAVPHLAGRREADVQATISTIRARRVHPGLFGRYYQLIIAIKSQQFVDNQVYFDDIIRLAEQEQILTVVPFTETALGLDMRCYAELLDLAAETPALLASPACDRWQAFEKNVWAALKLIDEADAELAADLRGLIIQIVGAASPPQGATRQFDGASSFMLWGAVFLNVDRHHTPLDVVEGLVHEAAHQLLFGESRNQSLVENRVAETFDSPLRRDPRPMVGVFHATFVCARVSYAYRQLRAARPGLLTAAEMRLVEQRIDEQKRRFQRGYETVLQHGRLTATGKRMLDSALACMQDAA